MEIVSDGCRGITPFFELETSHPHHPSQTAPAAPPTPPEAAPSNP
jgi:hypothetical protein